jgi:glycosyltransferase involved in cell wall biosynthesis
MRIAFLDSWLQDSAAGSGTAMAIGGLAEGLRALGHEVERIAPPAGAPGPLLWRRLWYNLSLAERLGDGADFDLALGFDIDGCFVADRLSIPYICCVKGVHGDEQRFERGWARLELYGLSLLERRNARRAPLVLSPSAYCQGRIASAYGVPAERNLVLSEGITLDTWLTDPASWAEEDERRDPHTVLCVCRQYPRKRVIDLVTAFRRVLDRLPEARLVIIGDGPEHAGIAAEIRRQQLDGAVQLLGALPSHGEVREWYRRSSVFCLPSRQEGFGIVFLEAMASGLPVVSIADTAIPEVVPHAEAGLLVPPGDLEALAEALVQLLADPERRARFRRFGREHVRQFAWRQVAGRLLELAEPLLRNGRSDTDPVSPGSGGRSSPPTG